MRSASAGSSGLNSSKAVTTRPRMAASGLNSNVGPTVYRFRSRMWDSLECLLLVPGRDGQRRQRRDGVTHAGVGAAAGSVQRLVQRDAAE